MLSPEVLSILKQSVPVLEEKGVEITKTFYDILFERNPELKNLFNLANQRNGNQAKALAGAIFAYANLAEHPEQLMPMVNRIAHKHISLNILPEHYPLVGEALLMALSKELDLPLEHGLIQSWGEAYQSLAEVFINHEANLYEENDNQPGGWRDFRRFNIDKIVEETDEVKSFYLVPADEGGLALFKAGQYVGVKLDIPGHPYQEIRQYSLSDSPGQAHYRITVKAEPGKPAGMVSNHLHQQLSEGDSLMISAPAGDFILPKVPERDVVLVSAGVGVTPMMSMLKTQLQKQSDISTTFIHCAQNKEKHCLQQEIKDLKTSYNFACFTAYMDDDSGDHQGFLDQPAMDKFLAEDGANNSADYYFCGPFPFMVALRKLLLDRGVKEEQLHYEVFGPTLSLAA